MLRTDGSIVSWGADSAGQVSSTPAGTGFVQLAAGADHSVALDSSGSTVSWGNDAEGEVSDTPSGTGFVRVGAGGFHSLAVQSDGTIVAWGGDSHGQVSEAPTGPTFREVTGGLHHSLALTGPAPAVPQLPSYVAYCTAGTTAAGCQAYLAAAGIPSASAASGFTVTASYLEGQRVGVFYQGTAGRQAAAWGNGNSFQCVVPPLTRLGMSIGSGTPGACDGTLARDVNSSWNEKPAKNPGAGTLTQLQLWYRDPANTSNRGTNLSNAIEFTVVP